MTTLRNPRPADDDRRPPLRLLQGGPVATEVARIGSSEPQSEASNGPATPETAPAPKEAPPRGVPREVIRAAQSGDVEAFSAIVDEFQSLVHSTVYRMIGGRLREQVEDVTQDVFLRLFRVLPRFDVDRGTRFSSWVLTLVKNHCYDVLKKRRLPTVSMNGQDPDDPLPEPPASTPEPSRTLLGDEVQAAVAEAVDLLPEAQRLVFVLREYEELSYQEIADVLGCSEGTVKSRLHRAKEALRARLAPILNPEPEDLPAGTRLKVPRLSKPA